MAKRFDSGWRDARLPLVHSAWDVPIPVAGMPFVMVEYDRGAPLAVVNYIRRDADLPRGPEVAQAYAALGALFGPECNQLPFLTVQYDPRNWAMRLYPHNGPARKLIGADNWLPVTEEHFVRLLYRLRGRKLPVLSSYGIELSSAPWANNTGLLPPQGWAGHEMSIRRRDYEPDGVGVRFNMRNPCTDIDLAVVGKSGTVTLLVDYKLSTAHVDPSHKTHQAMGLLADVNGNPIPSMIVKYDPTSDVEWAFHALALNRPAELLLIEVLTNSNAIAPTTQLHDWAYLNESRWVDLLERAQSL